MVIWRSRTIAQFLITKKRQRQNCKYYWSWSRILNQQNLYPSCKKYYVERVCKESNINLEALRFLNPAFWKIKNKKCLSFYNSILFKPITPVRVACIQIHKSFNKYKEKSTANWTHNLSLLFIIYFQISESKCFNSIHITY